MKLFANDWGVFPRRITIYLREKGIEDIDLVPIDLMTGEHRSVDYLKINPAGTIPALGLDDGTTILQSTSIMEYLEEIYPQPNMIGTTPRERAKTRDLMSMINDCYLYQLNYLAQISPFFKDMLVQSPEAADAFLFRYNRVISVLEEVASDGPFLAGERVTMADCAFYSLVQYTEIVYGAKLPEQSKKLQAFYERFASRPSGKMGDMPAFLLNAATPA